MNGMYWNSERIYVESCAISIGDDAVFLCVDAEVPMIDNERQPRKGNRYFPTFIEIICPEAFYLKPEEAREFAHKLMAAAQACESIDLPDTDRCGHWFPCHECQP